MHIIHKIAHIVSKSLQIGSAIVGMIVIAGLMMSVTITAFSGIVSMFLGTSGFQSAIIASIILALVMTDAIKRKTWSST